MIRIRIVQEPTVGSIDGVRLDCFHVGQEYEAGNTVGALLLAEGWAVPVPLDAPAAALPFGDDDPYDHSKLYPVLPKNLVRDPMPPYLDRPVAADFSPRKRRRHRRRAADRPPED